MWPKPIPEPSSTRACAMVPTGKSSRRESKTGRWPIVCTPSDAFRCFMGTELDVLVIGNFFLQKQAQDPALAENYKEKYGLD